METDANVTTEQSIKGIKKKRKKINNEPRK
jgi:hypothetical protein